MRDFILRKVAWQPSCPRCRCAHPQSRCADRVDAYPTPDAAREATRGLKSDIVLYAPQGRPHAPWHAYTMAAEDRHPKRRER